MRLLAINYNDGTRHGCAALGRPVFGRAADRRRQANRDIIDGVAVPKA
jgi:hypothetical protein